MYFKTLWQAYLLPRLFQDMQYNVLIAFYARQKIEFICTVARGNEKNDKTLEKFSLAKERKQTDKQK